MLKIGDRYVSTRSGIAMSSGDASEPPMLIVVRHSETALNSQYPERIRGWADIPLDEGGEKNVDKISKEVVDGHKLNSPIYTSDLIRAKKVAMAIGRLSGLPVTPTIDLRPWNLGIFQEQPVEGPQSVVDQIDTYVKNPDMKVPKGESLNTFKDRFLGFMDPIFQRVDNGSRLVIVTHTRNIKLLYDMVTGHEKDLIQTGNDPCSPGQHMIISLVGNKWKVTTPCSHGGHIDKVDT